MYLCWKNLFSSCAICIAALHILRTRVSELSTKQELIDCHIWIGEQQDSHWRSHLYEWLQYIQRNKRDTKRRDAKSIEVQEELKKFRNNIMNE
jgi:hypothetical protein